MSRDFASPHQKLRREARSLSKNPNTEHKTKAQEWGQGWNRAAAPAERKAVKPFARSRFGVPSTADTPRAAGGQSDRIMSRSFVGVMAAQRMHKSPFREQRGGLYAGGNTNAGHLYSRFAVEWFKAYGIDCPIHFMQGSGNAGNFYLQRAHRRCRIRRGQKGDCEAHEKDSGNRMINSVPLPKADLTDISPLCSITVFLTI